MTTWIEEKNWNDVRKELEEAFIAYPSMHSAHEGYAIILGEVDELWDEVKKKPSRRVAAMAMRFLFDVVPPKHLPED